MGPDFSQLLASVDFGDVGEVLLALAALCLGHEVIAWGARRVLAFMSPDEDMHSGGYYEMVGGELHEFDAGGRDLSGGESQIDWDARYDDK